MAAPAAAVEAVLLAPRPAAVVAVLLVLRPVLLVLELAADLAHKPLLLAQAVLQVVAVLVRLVAVPVELLLSRQSPSAAMARISTSPPPPYDPVQRSRWPPKGRPCPSP